MTSTREKIVLAAVFCEQFQATRIVRLEDLIVACWRLFPSSFSLAGYDLPHSSRVIAKLSGVDGLVAEGDLARGEQGVLRVTRVGRAKVAKLVGLDLDEPEGAWVPSVAQMRKRPDAPVTRLRRERAPRAPRVAEPALPPPPKEGWWSVPKPQRFVGSPRIR